MNPITRYEANRANTADSNTSNFSTDSNGNPTRKKSVSFSLEVPELGAGGLRTF